MDNSINTPAPVRRTSADLKRTAENAIGRRFDRLIVLAVRPTGRASVFCRCDCGNEKWMLWRYVEAGLARSCGCLGAEKRLAASTTHGRFHSPTYQSWLAMKARCSNPKHSRYPYYGGRGITVAPAWRTFEGFLADMGDSQPGMTIERVDNDKGYGPGNCRWATRREQSRNRRCAVNLTIGGVTKSLPDWADESGTIAGTIRTRLRLGWSAKDAVWRPARKAARVR